MSIELAESAPSRARIALAFAAVYITWGSTYLAIHFAIETLPPFLMAGTRFLVAGALLYGWARLRGAKPPTRGEWISAGVIGALLLVGGNGAVVWAEQRITSGVAALLVAFVPFWMVLIEWLRPGGSRPTAWVIAGLALGFTGLALLVGPGALGGDRVDGLGTAVLILGCLSWATGSVYSRGARLPSSPMLSTAMQMLVGGALLGLLGTLYGETARISPHSISLRSLMGLLYLISFGSLVGYTAYVWLLKVSTPARVSTFAYVNPVVAVFLGWAVAGEPLSPRILIAAAIIIGAVAVITMARMTRSAPAPGVKRGSRGAPRPTRKERVA